MEPQEQIAYLIGHPEELLKKKPFTRGSNTVSDRPREGENIAVGETRPAELPAFERREISQARFLAELDPDCHDVLFDDNIPSITQKLNDGTYVEIEFKKMAIPFQKMIRNKHVLHLCGYPTTHTLDAQRKDPQAREDFSTFKRYWKLRNQDGMRSKMIAAQMSVGDAGLLYYFDRNGELKCRVISYQDGYVLCPHNDKNGDRLIESVYYRIGDVEYIDSYTDTYQYRHVRSYGDDSKGKPAWRLIVEEPHGFAEIPLITKRGDVPWGVVQSTIEAYEVQYNIFLVVQKRHGWGILYIKGAVSDTARKVAGAVVLQDTSLGGNGAAQYLTPPSPEGTIETLKLMEETIQKGSGTTFILPKDISMSGDISGVAIQIAQSLDNEEALTGAIEWQNVISKMSRLFKYGIAKELVAKGKDSSAVTRFGALEITSKIKPWKPRSDSEYNQMLLTMEGAGILSRKTAVELNTESAPDEEIRLSEQQAEEDEREVQKEILINQASATKITANDESGNSDGN